MLPGKPADASAEGVPDDADVSRRAVERGQPVSDGRVHDVAPQRPARHASDASDGVDLDARHARHVDQQGALERGAAGAVARSLDGDTQADSAGVVDGGDHVVDGLGERDRGGPLVDGEVPGAASVVPARLAGEDEQVGGGCGAARVLRV